MKFNNLLLYLISFQLIIFTSCTLKEKNSEFTVSGIYTGGVSKYVILSYKDSTANIINDTLPIIDGKFKAQGNLNEISNASLFFEKMPQNNLDILPLTCFFIEPGEISIILNEGDFRNVSFQGSSVQDEFKHQENQILAIYNELNRIVIERTPLSRKRMTGRADSATINRLRELERKRIKLLDSIKLIKLNYSATNKDSQLAAFYLLKYFKDLDKEYVKRVYQNFDISVKLGLFGQQLSELIKNRKPSDIGDKVPRFSSIDLEGNYLDLNDYKKKYILLDFWASWCKPCIENLPKLKYIYNTYNDIGLEIIGISIDKKNGSWRKALEKENMHNWPNYIDNSVDVGNRVQSVFNFTSIPQYILIDKNGVIIGKYTTNLNELEVKLKELF